MSPSRAMRAMSNNDNEAQGWFNILAQAQQSTLASTCLKTSRTVFFSGSCCRHTVVRSAISPDGRYALSGSEDGRPYVWEMRTGDVEHGPLGSFRFGGPLLDCDWHPSEHMIALCSYGKDAP